MLRKMFGATAGTVAIIAAVVDAVSRLETVEHIVPAKLNPYLPVLYLGGFVIALLALRFPPPADAAMYRENVRHRNAIEELTTRNAELGAQVSAIAPRRLSTDQKERLLARFRRLNGEVRERGHSGLQIFINWVGAGDCADYARQFADTFRSAGFQVIQDISLSRRSDDDYHYGLFLRWDSERYKQRGLPAVGSGISSALDEVGIAVNLMDDHDWHALTLIVGARR
jgi:hypothetical protein